MVAITEKNVLFYVSEPCIKAGAVKKIKQPIYHCRIFFMYLIIHHLNCRILSWNKADVKKSLNLFCGNKINWGCSTDQLYTTQTIACWNISQSGCVRLQMHMPEWCCPQVVRVQHSSSECEVHQMAQRFTAPASISCMFSTLFVPWTSRVAMI